MSEVQSWLMDENKSPIQKDEDKTARVLISTLYEIYTTNKMMSKTQFGKDINKIEGLDIRTIKGYNYLYGYKLKPDEDNNDDEY